MIVYIWLEPEFTFVVPAGVMLPFTPVVAVIVYWLGANVAKIVCDAATLVNWYVVTLPTELLSTNTSAT